MKKLFLGICYTLLTQIVISQTILGRLTDSATKAPIVAATVELENLTTVLTNEHGEFSFPRIRPGNYTLRISSVGYKTVEKTVNLSTAIIPLHIALEQWNLFMQPVEVRAIRANDRAPFTKTNISKKEI